MTDQLLDHACSHSCYTRTRILNFVLYLFDTIIFCFS